MKPETKIYIEVILPLDLADSYTYHVMPNHENKILVGERVVVPFGKSKIYTGIVAEVGVKQPELYKTKEIFYVLDKSPIVSQKQLNLWKWVSQYYVCSLGQVFRNQFPAGLRLESESFVKATTISNAIFELTETENLVLEVVKNRQIISVKELQETIDKKNIISSVNALVQKGLIQLDEKLVQRYKRKYQKFLTINANLIDKKQDQSAVFKELEKSPKQREVILKLLSLFLQENKPVLLSAFIKEHQLTYAVIKSLEEKNLVLVTDTEILRHQSLQMEKEALNSLSSNEIQSLKEIEEKLDASKILLLEHELFSEKEKIVFKLIEKEIAKGGKVLYLLPNVSQAEIFQQQLDLLFPNQVISYHSGMSLNENTEAYLGVLQNKFSVIIGVRSAPFLPLNLLSLVLVEQEQDQLYKQKEIRPYFNTREVAVYLASMCGAKCVLTSLAPSVESYYNVNQQKYGYHKLLSQQRRNIPRIELIDLKESYKKKTMKGTISEKLEMAIREELKKKKKIVIYQNRKGYAPVLECADCGHTNYCPQCDVSLTFYKDQNLLKCHFCGHSQEKPSKCFRCKSDNLLTHGIGIEQIEKDLQVIFPKNSIVKLSSETASKKNYFEKISEDFEEDKIDILIGTQLLLRLKSFEKVGLLAVIKIDADLNQKSIKAHENTFQNMLRLAQLMPKKGLENKILLQTTIPDHQVLQNLSIYNYKEVLQNLIYERKNFLYPPYAKLIQIRLKHKKFDLVEKASHQLKRNLEQGMKEHILGPETPNISRIRNEYIKNILIKILPEKSSKKIKEYIRLQINNLQKVSAFKQVKIEIDIDPMI